MSGERSAGSAPMLICTSTPAGCMELHKDAFDHWAACSGFDARKRYSSMGRKPERVLNVGVPSTLSVKHRTQPARDVYRQIQIGLPNYAQVAFVSLSHSGTNSRVHRDIFLAGSLDSNGKLHSFLSHKISDHCYYSAIASASCSDVRKPAATLTLNLESPRSGTCLLFSTAGLIYGLQSTYLFEKIGLRVGAELFGSAVEKSGGLSVAASLFDKHSELVLCANPVMGHCTLTRYMMAADNLRLAVRYSFNAYSRDSNIRWGLEYGRENIVRASLDMAKGVQFAYQLRLGQVGLVCGFSTAGGQNTHSTTFGLELTD